MLQTASDRRLWVFQVKKEGLDSQCRSVCASLYAIVDAIESMQHLLNAFHHATMLVLPNWSSLDIASLLCTAQGTSPPQPSTPSRPLAAPPITYADLLRKVGSANLSKLVILCKVIVEPTSQGHQASSCYTHWNMGVRICHLLLINSFTLVSCCRPATCLLKQF